MSVRLDPIVDRIGQWEIRHGERGDLDPEHPEACLCGRPYYLSCCEWAQGRGGTVATVVIGGSR